MNARRMIRTMFIAKPQLYMENVYCYEKGLMYRADPFMRIYIDFC